jgi:hypothetical protein
MLMLKLDFKIKKIRNDNSLNAITYLTSNIAENIED